MKWLVALCIALFMLLLLPERAEAHRRNRYRERDDSVSIRYRRTRVSVRSYESRGDYGYRDYGRGHQRPHVYRETYRERHYSPCGERHVSYYCSTHRQRDDCLCEGGRPHASVYAPDRAHYLGRDRYVDPYYYGGPYNYRY